MSNMISTRKIGKYVICYFKISPIKTLMINSKSVSLMFAIGKKMFLYKNLDGNASRHVATGTEF